MIGGSSGCGLCPWRSSGKVGAYVIHNMTQGLVLHCIAFMLTLVVTQSNARIDLNFILVVAFLHPVMKNSLTFSFHKLDATQRKGLASLVN